MGFPKPLYASNCGVEGSAEGRSSREQSETGPFVKLDLILVYFQGELLSRILVI